MSNGVRSFPDSLVAEYTASGAWGTETVSELVRQLCRSGRGDRPAYIAGQQQLTWHEYDQTAGAAAAALAGVGLPAHGLVGVFLPDLPITHVLYLALEKAGLTAVGIGPRSGMHEMLHLLRTSGATALITLATFRDDDQRELFRALAAELPGLRHHIVLTSLEPLVMEMDGTPLTLSDSAQWAGEGLGPNDLFMINATSGTTGLPKCVQHTQNRWLYFARHAVRAGELTDADVVMGVLPAPFGFGLWSAHFLPPVLGIPVVLMDQWDAHEALAQMRRHRVTVFIGVTTQLMMLLDLLEAGEPPPPELRVIFTGGEAVPYERTTRFEKLTGARVLQFYGSNESGALSCTTMRDDESHRLRTAGRIIDDMQVQLIDPDTGAVLDEPGQVGQPTCYGPLMSPGYFNDAKANATLFDGRGHMRMGDLATISADGYLTVVGRVADIIIRGGMNVSASEVEAGVLSHPAVDLVAVVGAPHETFGEQICAFVQLRSGEHLELDELRAHLDRRGMAKYSWPEQLRILDAMPRNAGEKIAKDVLRRLAAEQGVRD
jgi:acyl-CoA synthetase